MITSKMSEDWRNYVNDPRTICRYGARCYQKNQEHLMRFKHPPTNVKRKYPDSQHVEKPYKIQARELKPAPTVQSCVKDDEPPLATVKKAETIISEIKIALPDTVTYYTNVEDKHKLLKNLFLVDLPADFYEFYDCLSNGSQDIVKTLSAVNLQLIGPYDLFLGKLPILDDKELYLIHWRFFYDPPEYQALFKSRGYKEYHIGYYRDSPDQKPVFVASNDSSQGCNITPLADNVFGAVYLYLQNERKKSPFTSMACQKLMDKIKEWATKKDFSLEPYNMKNRASEIVAKTLHGAGIVVPYNKKTKLGYRPLAESYGTIKKLFTKLEGSTSQAEKDSVMSELQPVITYANIAVDECDFGTGLECGIDLFCSGIKDLEPSALSCLYSVYLLLRREAFSKIIQAHLKYRRKGPHMSILGKE